VKQQLRKPENWQDFEDLCRLLWSEIWNCPETKKNGRLGQEQHGVDVYGTPSWEKASYYGIQCKGKDDYTHAQLTKSEIDREIEKAKSFKPALKKFYFATTANKNGEIEEYIRIKDVESRTNGLFEIHLFSWEEIVALIDQNKRTYDWYVRKINFKTAFGIDVSFENGEKHLDFFPILLRNHVKYFLEKPDTIFFRPLRDPETERNEKLELITEPQPTRYYVNGVTHNKSSCVFSIIITNVGDNALENYKFYFQLSDCNVKIDTVSKQTKMLDPCVYEYNTFITDKELNGVIEPYEGILVQKETIESDKICIRPNIAEEQNITLSWELIAKDFSTSGKLTIAIKPKIIEKHSTEEYAYHLEDEIRLENYFGEKEYDDI
jgi:hypothetical protein